MLLNNSLLFWDIILKLKKGENVATIGGKVYYDGRSDEWVDFTLKINYIYERLFDGDKKRLIEYFSDKNKLTKKYLTMRKKTIDNWLTGESLKPKNFDLKIFKIGELLLNNEPLFTRVSFEVWSIEVFKNRLDCYLSNQKNHSHIQYIYFFDTNCRIQKICSFDVSFPDHKNEDNIELHYANMLYRGTIESFNNSTYIRVKNEYDYIDFIFRISANTSKNIKVFGMALSVDDSTGRPKAFRVLLSSYLLSKEEEAKYAHKLNFSNTMLADEFSQKCVLEEDYFMENFIQKIEILGRDLSHCGINEKFSENIYTDIILKEYQNYIKLLERANGHTKYAITSKKESEIFSMKGISEEEKAEVSISYFLTLENLFLLDNTNPIIENQIRLIKEDLLDLTYIFVVTDRTLLIDDLIQKIEYMEESGIKIKMTNNISIGPSKLLLIKNTNFALFKSKDSVDNPIYITKHTKIISKLFLEQKLLEQETVSLREFMKKENPLCGKWYYYSYGSVMPNNECHEIELEIKNHQVVADFASGIHYGVVYKTAKQTLLIFDNTTIKIAIDNVENSIFRVSAIGQDISISTADLLVFGIFSKERLEQEDVLLLLSSIHMKEKEDYRLKVSDSFPRELAEFKRKRELKSAKSR
jgi:hypothetical protein